MKIPAKNKVLKARLKNSKKGTKYMQRYCPDCMQEVPTRKGIALVTGEKIRKCLICGKRLYSKKEIAKLKRKDRRLSRIVNVDEDALKRLPG